MNPMIIKEMAPLTRQRYHFAASSFSRIYGVPNVTEMMLGFCVEWATQKDTAPLDCLYNVDMYFKEKWDQSQGG